MAIQAQIYQENLGFSFCSNNTSIINYPQDFMAEIGGSNNNGCGVNSMSHFSFNPQQNQQYYQPQQQYHQQQMVLQDFQSLNQRNEGVWVNNNTVIPTTNPQSQSQSQSQSMFDHVDQFIKFQNERLRLMIQEQRRQNLMSLMKKVEPKLVGLLREKEEEVCRATKRTSELENLLRSLESENATWQTIARENEATVVSLSNALEQAREIAGDKFDAVVAEDAESCCDGEESPENTIGGICKRCGRRSSCVLLLPCRHFCSCKDCEAFLDSCPVCQQPKKASIEALTF